MHLDKNYKMLKIKVFIKFANFNNVIENVIHTQFRKACEKH